MYESLIFLHTTVRWILLAGLLYAIGSAANGYFKKLPFSKKDNTVRHWTATIAHIQLVIGIILYTKSPVVHYFLAHFREALSNKDATFFGIIHITMMLIAIVTLTIGSALSKRKPTDPEKFKTMLYWFSAALFLIFIAIPWPFSPLANRPYFR